MSYLVDSNVLCEATRPQADSTVLKWLEQHDSELHVSVITMGEIDKGIHLLTAGKKKERLRRWFAELTSAFGARILPVDQIIMSQWAQLCAQHQLGGRLYPAFDSVLAATALTHRLIVVTRNTEDFPADVPTLNP